ncbi:MAG: squalene/phytoene synthase family protein [bacterium]|nr:squalene/phytoene synthase family protein [bacterium]
MSPVKSELEKYQMQFGLALQLTNILKDWRKDLNRGWCYLIKGDKIISEQVQKILEISKNYADSDQLLRKDYLRLKKMLR